MKPKSISHWFEQTAATRAFDTAVTFFRDGQVETVLSYEQLNADADAFAAWLQADGIHPGDRVVLLLDKSLIAVTAYLALQKLGVTVVPLNPGFKKSELEYLLTDASASMIILSPEKEIMVRDLIPGLRRLAVSTTVPYQSIEFFKTAPAGFDPPIIHPADPALIIYTSGTTGNPKGAVLTQANLLRDAENVISIWEISARDILCHALPLFHVHGLCFALHTLLFSGGHLIMLDAFRPELVVRILAGRADVETCTLFMAVPAMYTKLLSVIDDTPFDFSRLRLITSGSAPLPESVFVRIEKTFGIAPVEREGMSETGMNFSNPVHGRRKPGSIGRPLPGLEVRIVDPATHLDVAPGSVGELWLKSPAITPGYFRKPVETEATFEGGWFKTGDLGKIDDDGYYYITDRIKHIIITGGENVSAKEVETVINRVDGVVESSVVGIDDEKWGERVVAAVVAAPGATLTEAQIIACCREQLHDWKCPKKIVFIDEIPRNTMGKMLKEKVKAYF